MEDFVDMNSLGPAIIKFIDYGLSLMNPEKPLDLTPTELNTMLRVNRDLVMAELSCNPCTRLEVEKFLDAFEILFLEPTEPFR